MSRPLRGGPVYVTNAVTNLFNPAAVSGGLNCGPYTSTECSIRQIHVANVTAGAVTLTLYLGLTGASTGGTEIVKGLSIPANSEIDLPFTILQMRDADFITGIASANGSLVISFMGQIDVV